MAANTMKYLFAFFDVAEPKAISHIPIYELSLGLLWAWAFVELPMIEAFIFSLITLLITAIGWIDLKSFKIPFLLIITSSLILIGSIFLDQIQATPAFLGLSIGGIIPWAIMVTTSIFTKRKGMGTGDFQDELDKIYEERGYKFAHARHLNTHNQFLQSWIALGIPGVTLILGIFIVMFQQALKNRDWLYVGFTTIFLVISLTESSLYMQAGVVYFSFFAVLFARKSQSNPEPEA